MSTTEQAAFAVAWRKAHPEEVYGPSWTCPLCGKIFQASENNADYAAFMASMADKHQRFHGQDWLSYAAIGAAAEQMSPEAGT